MEQKHELLLAQQVLDSHSHYSAQRPLAQAKTVRLVAAIDEQ